MHLAVKSNRGDFPENPLDEVSHNTRHFHGATEASRWLGCIGLSTKLSSAAS